MSLNPGAGLEAETIAPALCQGQKGNNVCQPDPAAARGAICASSLRPVRSLATTTFNATAISQEITAPTAGPPDQPFRRADRARRRRPVPRGRSPAGSPERSGDQQTLSVSPQVTTRPIAGRLPQATRLSRADRRAGRGGSTSSYRDALRTSCQSRDHGPSRG